MSKGFRSLFLVGGTVFGAGYGANYVFKTHNAHEDAALCAILYETHENPESKGVSPWQNHRIRNLMEYRDSGFWNVLLNEPPQRALERFRDRDPHVYSMQLLKKSQESLMSMVTELDQAVAAENERNNIEIKKMWIFIYPLFATFWTLRRPLKAELQHWLIWWLTYQCMCVVRTRILWWVPLITYIESLLLLILYFPPSTDYVRKEYICVSKKKIQKFIKNNEIVLFVSDHGLKFIQEPFQRWQILTQALSFANFSDNSHKS